jgi:hypothetical protein
MPVKSTVPSTSRRGILAVGMVTLLSAAVAWTVMQNSKSKSLADESPATSTTASSAANPTPASNRRPASSITNKTSAPLNLTVTATAPSLSDRSKAIETRALRKLAQLDESLNLTKSQQQRVFSILVRSDISYDPAMQVAGESGAEAITTPNDAIVETLDPARQEKFELALIDDASWWDATMAKIESARTDEATKSSSQDDEEPINPDFR